MTYNDPALGCLLGTAYQRLLSLLAASLKEAGLEITTSEYLVLRALYSTDGIQQCEIADKVGKDKASICRCVTALVQKGLVRTESVSHKCQRVYLTEKARDMQAAVMEVARKRHQSLMKVTSPEDLATLERVLKEIVKQ